MKYLGCAYYPEGIEADLERDIALMKELGVNMVRLGEFAWSVMEKTEGAYDFSLFRRVIDRLAEERIDVLMCTPTATPPAWLTRGHPETLVVDAAGHRAMHGIRQHCCYGSEKFVEMSRRITDAMTKALCGCENIVAWQIDNELAQRLQGPCCCESCQRGFRNYLRRRYETLENLNFLWKNEFWSQSYSDWDEIFLAFPDDLWRNVPAVVNVNYSVSRVLDSMRFYEVLTLEYMMSQAAVVRKNIPRACVTTNNPAAEIFDLGVFFRDLDIAAGDLYWGGKSASAKAEVLTRQRSYKNARFFVAETGLGGDYLDLPAGQRAAKLDFWRAFAHGAMSYLVFRWAPPLGGQEQNTLGLVTHAGKPRRTYQVAKELFASFNALRKELTDTGLPAAKVAILYDGDVAKTYLRHANRAAIRYDSLGRAVFGVMHARNIPVAIVSPDSPIDDYQLLVLPSQQMIRKDLSAKIERFVRNGGTVWALGELNCADSNGNFTTGACPEHLTEVFGVVVHEGACVPSRGGTVRLGLEGVLGGEKIDTDCLGGCWIADIETIGAETLLCFADNCLSGQAALTCNRYGSGKAFYQGISDPGSELLDKIGQMVIDASGIDYWRECPAGVEIIDCGRVLFLLNNNDREVSFSCPFEGKALHGSFSEGVARLPPLDLCIVKRFPGA